MADIIVVEDEPDVAQLVADVLGQAGHRVRVAGRGAELRSGMRARAADLVVLDINLPDEDGLSLARWLRNGFDGGIVMLTALDMAFDRIAALEIGADDYVAKPFEPEELEARIAAVLRRRRPAGGQRLSDGQHAFGPYVFDEASRRLVDSGGSFVPLSDMELDLVSLFATNPGRAFTRDELLERAPPRTGEPFDRSIDSRITRLRRRLEADPSKPELIKTIRGAGYLFPR